MNDDKGKLPLFGLGGLVDSSCAQMNDDKGKLPPFGFGGLEERRHRHMLAQALSNWGKRKRGRPKAPWRVKLFPAILRTMYSHPEKKDTERALIMSKVMRPCVDIRTVQNWLSTVRKRML